MKNFASYFDAVTTLELLIPSETRGYMQSQEKDKNFFLQRTQRFFDALGNPEKKFQYIHIAGTSGKGSTATMIHNILNTAGWKVGLYTSPHVTTSIERITINGQLIAPDDFANTVTEIMSIVHALCKNNPNTRPSYTDVILGIALRLFQRHHVKWIVLETGCGGRFDHTNIIPAPAVAVITNVTREHVGVLGDTIEEIAWHKAGIIKKGSHVFSAETNSIVRAMFDKEIKRYGGQVQYVTRRKDNQPVMLGQHQCDNSALATAVAQFLGIDAQNIARGIAETRLPARVEVMQKHPFVILDGAHAPAKIEALAAFLKTEPRFLKARSRTAIFAPKEGKEVKALIAPLAPLFDHVVITSWQLPGFQSANPHDVANLWKNTDPTAKITVIPNAHEALQRTLNQNTARDAIVITGSLYLAGFLRSHWVTEEDILVARSAFPTA